MGYSGRRLGLNELMSWTSRWCKRRLASGSWHTENPQYESASKDVQLLAKSGVRSIYERRETVCDGL